jgi:hypothetical protein
VLSENIKICQGLKDNGSEKNEYCILLGLSCNITVPSLASMIIILALLSGYFLVCYIMILFILSTWSLCCICVFVVVYFVIAEISYLILLNDSSNKKVWLNFLVSVFF